MLGGSDLLGTGCELASLQLSQEWAWSDWSPLWSTQPGSSRRTLIMAAESRRYMKQLVMPVHLQACDSRDQLQFADQQLDSS
jgi:hypothetical protein